MDTNEIKIRPATEADAAEILNIYAPYITDTAITFEYSVLSVQFQVPDKAVFQHHCACNPSLHKS